YVYEEPSIQLTRDAVGIGVLSIIPCELADRLREHSLFLIGPLHGFGEAVDDVEVGTAVGDGFHGLITPLRPSAAVDDAAFLLYAGTGGEHEHFGRIFRRVDAGAFPKARGFVFEQVRNHQPVELIHTRTDQTRVG